MKYQLALLGSRSQRTPFTYAGYEDLFKQFFDFAPSTKADIFVFAMSFEIAEFFELNPELLRSLKTWSVWLISEEPLWDTVWNQKHLTDESYSIEVQGVSIVVNQISHFVHSPFIGLELPYFLTTQDSYFLYYQLFFRKRLMQPLLVQQPSRGVGLLEFRSDSRNDVVDTFGRLIGLSNYRSRSAQFLRFKGLFDMFGLGWKGKRLFPEKRRQDAVDFHLQKLVTLESQYGFVFALENTLQQEYVSEKVFDALAVGGLPVYYAPQGHDVFRFVPERDLINAFDRSFVEVAAEIEGMNEAERADRVIEGVKAVTPLFEDFGVLERSRKKVVERIVAVMLEEIESC